MAGATGLSALMAGRSANQLPPEAMQALTGQSDLAKSMSGLAGTLNQRFTLSGPSYSKALDYYHGLINPGVGGLQAQLGPETGRLNETYRGTETKIKNSMVGPQRDQQLGDLSRQKAFQLSGMGQGLRGDAAKTLLGEGGAGSAGPALGAMGSAAGQFGSIADFYRVWQQQKNQNTSQLGADWVKMFLPYLMKQGKGQGPD